MAIASLVSIIIPCYNAEAYVGEAIESALRQTHEPTEVIVIDDGSTDGSLDVIRSFGDRITWRAGKNRGACHARNRGLALASGEYVKFLDADDVLLEEAIERQVEQMHQIDDERASVFGTARYIDERGMVQEGEGNLRQIKTGEDPIAYILHVNPQTSLPLHRRQVLLEVGGFDEDLSREQEYNLHFRLYLAGASLHYEPTPVTLIRRHEGTARITNQSHFQTDPEMQLNRIRDRERMVRDSEVASLSGAVRRQLALASWRDGRRVLRAGDSDTAYEYFSYAKALHPKRHVAGASRMYRWCVWLLGPVWAEHIGRGARMLKGS